MNPRYSIYVPTKGRWEVRQTLRTFDKIGVPYKAVVEPQEYDHYAAVVDRNSLLVMPHSNQGLVVTRNWIWDHAQASGAKRFWTFDDNIGTQASGLPGLYRLNRNMKIPVASATCLCIIEDFVERYENVPIAGMNYFMFAKRKDKVPPFYLNTRVYSNMLIETNARDLHGKLYRNEGFYNDDTDLCLRILKDGFCTILFNAFLIDKRVTMTVKGGMTPHYQSNLEGEENKENDGRWRMAKELQDKHPELTTITRKFGRWQHHVDYSSFTQKLIRKPGWDYSGVNNYGMELKQLDGDGEIPAERLRQKVLFT